MKDSKPATLPVASIKVGRRHRKDLGDIDGLAQSIRERGLLHPVVVTAKGGLVAGERRLEALKLLGWSEAPVTVVANLADAAAMLRAERDENTCRKDFTPSEAVALGKALEEWERQEAERRRSAGRPKVEKKTPVNFSGHAGEEIGDARDRVGAAVGMSGPTYEKAKAVVEAAEREPERFGDLAERMDESGKVDGAFQELKKRQSPPAPPPAPAHPHSAALARWLGLVTSEMHIIQEDRGGIRKLLAEREKWDWRDVRECLLPMIEELQGGLASFREEIERAAQQKDR